MANTIIYPYGVGGQTPSGIGLNAGTFADAYDLAKENNYIFPWMLIDEDEEGNPIKKMIWHTGNGEFIDAIGAEINGKKNGITVVVNSACDMKVNGKTFELSEGENNISLEEIDATNNQASEPKFYDSGTDTQNKSYLTKIDFGGFKTSGGWDLFSSYPNVTEIDRMFINMYSWSNGMLYSMSKLEHIKLSGTFSAYSFNKLLKNCPRLVKADLSGFTITMISQNDRSPSILEWFYKCTSLKEVDIRNADIHNCTSMMSCFSLCSSLKKLVIGNFSNAAMSSIDGAFAGVTGCTLICTTTTPPVFKNCAFSDGVPQDEYSSTNDWVAGHFSAIYVPSESVEAYKTNTYIEGGTVGNTGWSKYADIIYDIAEYDE